MEPGPRACELDIDLVRAHGLALALIGRLLERHGVAPAGELAELLGVMAAVTGERYPRQGEILAMWSSLVSDHHEALDVS